MYYIYLYVHVLCVMYFDEQLDNVLISLCLYYGMCSVFLTKIWCRKLKTLFVRCGELNVWLVKCIVACSVVSVFNHITRQERMRVHMHQLKGCAQKCSLWHHDQNYTGWWPLTVVTSGGDVSSERIAFCSMGSVLWWISSLALCSYLPVSIIKVLTAFWRRLYWNRTVCIELLCFVESLGLLWGHSLLFVVATASARPTLC